MAGIIYNKSKSVITDVHPQMTYDELVNYLMSKYGYSELLAGYAAQNLIGYYTNPGTDGEGTNVEDYSIIPDLKPSLNLLEDTSSYIGSKINVTPNGNIFTELIAHSKTALITAIVVIVLIAIGVIFLKR